MLYKYVGAASGPEAVELLKYFCEHQTLKASDPTTFNDPFEFKVEVDFTAEEDRIRARFFQDNPGRAEADYTSWANGFNKNAKWYLAQQTRQALLSTFGVVCLSTVEDNHLLWSHYATQHRGFCIAFDETIVETLPDVFGYGRVVYQSDIPVFQFYDESPEEYFRKACMHKSDQWGYEEEYRILFEKPGLVQFPVKPGVREVMLGCRAYQELRQYADQHLNSFDFPFFQMAEDLGKYRFIKIQIQKGTRVMSSHF